MTETADPSGQLFFEQYDLAIGGVVIVSLQKNGILLKKHLKYLL